MCNFLAHENLADAARSRRPTKDKGCAYANAVESSFMGMRVGSRRMFVS
jgi:hypothetical protein